MIYTEELENVMFVRACVRVCVRACMRHVHTCLLILFVVGMRWRPLAGNQACGLV